MIWLREKLVYGASEERGECPAVFQPWQELCAAIVHRAVDEYIDVLRKMWTPGVSVHEQRMLMRQKMELEQFFHSDWYELLCDIEPQKIIQCSIIRAKELEREAIERNNRKAIKKLLKDAV